MYLSYNFCCCDSNVTKAISEKIHLGLEFKVQSIMAGKSKELVILYPCEEESNVFVPPYTFEDSCTGNCAAEENKFPHLNEMNQNNAP